MAWGYLMPGHVNSIAFRTQVLWTSKKKMFMGVTCANQESMLHNQFSGWLMLACVSDSKATWEILHGRYGLEISEERIVGTQSEF